MNLFSLSKARPDQLDTIIAIDDESSKLYVQAGLKMVFDDHHPFVVAESIRWADAIRKGLVYLALDPDGRPVGFAALAMIDNQPFLDQLSVLPESMRQGVGTMLLEKAILWSAEKPLWLTTYSSVPWNRPYYERHGFVAIPEQVCGPELSEILQKQRAALPAPNDRIVMVRTAVQVSPVQP